MNNGNMMAEPTNNLRKIGIASKLFHMLIPSPFSIVMSTNKNGIPDVVLAIAGRSSEPSESRELNDKNKPR